MKKRVDPSIYTKEYYLNTCLGYDEFKSFLGKKTHPRARRLLGLVGIKNDMKVLDLGCGRGDISIYCAKLGANVIGVDYSRDAISLAKKALVLQNKDIRKRVTFLLLDAKKMSFEKNYFDLIIAIDIFEHLYKEELEIVMANLSRVLKPKGRLLAHTETNKLYLDFTHGLYIFPISSFLIWLNKIATKKNYPGLPKDPRNKFHKTQHVNEPTYFYLKGLFKRYNFSGKIIQALGLIKPAFSWKDFLYNVIVLLYPLSKLPPFIYFFATEYICVMRNMKNK